MVQVKNFRNGRKIVVNDIPMQIISFEKIGDKMKTQLLDLLSKEKVELEFSLDDSFALFYPEEKDVTFEYKENDVYYFMDENYDFYEIKENNKWDSLKFLKKDEECVLCYYHDFLYDIQIPTRVTLMVVAKKGNVAVLETGVEIEVPSHINVNDTIAVSTVSKQFLGWG